MDATAREFAALEAELKRVLEKLARIEDDAARKAARAVAEGRSDAEIERIHDSYNPELNKLWRVQERLERRLYRLARQF
jgi:hypothetical protein